MIWAVRTLLGSRERGRIYCRDYCWAATAAGDGGQTTEAHFSSGTRGPAPSGRIEASCSVHETVKAIQKKKEIK
jgi:hypothetical protein